MSTRNDTLVVDHEKGNTPAMMVFSLLALSQLLYFSLYTPFFAPIQRYAAVSILNSAVYLGVCLIIYRNKTIFSDSSVWIIILIGILQRCSVLFLEPTASDDIYRYIWDGLIQSHGIDPYRYAPSDDTLRYLHTNMVPGMVNFPAMKTIYPPLAEWIFWISFTVFGESILGFKIPLLIAETATLFLLRRVLRKLDLPAAWLALYAFCPLPIMQFMIDGHLDALGLPFVVLFILFWIRQKPLSALGWLGLASAIKLVPLIFIPFAFKDLRGWKRLLAVVIPTGILGVFYLPYIVGNGTPFEALGIFSSRWEFNGSVFHLLYPFIRDNTPTHQVCTVLFLIWMGYVYFQKYSFLDSLRLATFGFFIFAPTVHPWYLTWLAVLLPFRLRWSAIVFVAVVSLANTVVIDYKLTGVWQESGLILFIEYGLLAFVTVGDYFLLKKNRTDLNKSLDTR
jgi:alpha-1,6-mannosyltransferase